MIPFKRTLKLGSAGKDVVAVKRALSRAGFGKWMGFAFTPVYGPYSVIRVKRFQKMRRIKQDGVYGPITHADLEAYFDQYGKKLYGQQVVETPEQRTRRLIVEAARYFEQIKDRVHYTQGGRRMQIVREKLRPPLPSGRHIYEDCSSWVTGLYWIAGAPDPNGLGYNGQGYTGTLKRHGRLVSIRHAQPGDLVFYGRPDDVKVYIGKLRVIGNGGEAGPLETSFYWRWAFQEIRSYL